MEGYKLTVIWGLIRVMPVRPESQHRIFVEVVNNWDVPGLRTRDTNTTEWISSTVRPHQASHRRPKGLCFANPMLKLRSASSAPGHSGLPAKTTNEGKGHFINHPCGVGFVASLSKCSGDSDYSKLVQKTVQHWKKKNGISVTLKSKANAGRFWVIRLPCLGFLTQVLYDSICSNCCQCIFRSSQRSRWGHSERIIFPQLDPGSSSAGDSALPALGRFP